MNRMLSGSERKFRLTMQPIGNVHLADCQLKLEAFVFTNRRVLIGDSCIFKVDEDSYDIIIVTEDAKALGAGEVKLKIDIGIPDGDFPDKYRHEIYEVCVEK